jgi:hypothetical protein
MADLKISALTAATTPLGGTEVLPIVQSGSTVKASIANVQAAPVSAGTANGVQYLNASKVPTTGAVFTFDGYTPIVSFASNQIGYRAIGSASSTNPDAGANRGGVVQLQNNDTTDGNGNAIEYYNSNSLTSSYINGINVSHSGRTGAIVFGVANGGAPSEKWRINATGNLVVSTSGNGIDFSATPGTGTSELFNDYEEGEWTATFTGTTTAPTVPVTSTARYTKVGRLVTVNVNFPIPFATTGASGNVRVDGLPFTPLVAAFSAVSLADFGSAPAIAIASGTSITFNQAVDVYTPIAMTTTTYASLRLTLTFTV